MKPIDWDKLSDEEWSRAAAMGVMKWSLRVSGLTQEMHWCDEKGNRMCAYKSWTPCTRWDHAGMLVEEMVDNGYAPALVYDDDGHWALSFEGIQGPIEETDLMTVTSYVRRDEWHNRAPVAITKACVRAVMESEDSKEDGE